MDTLINITSLSGFLFCPYSIYLENVFSDMNFGVRNFYRYVSFCAAAKRRGQKGVGELDNEIPKL